MRYQIIVGKPNLDLPSNEIKTNKYTWLNFLPMNLFEQFRKAANLYFLMIAVLQSLPDVSLTNQIPAILTPLTFVITVSAIKDLFEDWRKAHSDKQENESKTTLVSGGSLVQTNWGDLRAGMVIRINNNESIPADVVCLFSSNTNKKCCFVETKSLDGETNLKVKKQIPVHVRTEDKHVLGYLEEVTQYSIRFEKENSALTKFIGELATSVDGTIPLSLEHLLLRGCVLKNTEYIYAVVIYPGHWSKIMQNSVTAKIKRSSLDRETNGWIKFIFLAQLAFCIFASLYYVVTLYFKQAIFQQFIFYKRAGFVWEFLIRMGNWILMFRWPNQ
jgi:phospholipid-transporting ATPase